MTNANRLSEIQRALKVPKGKYNEFGKFRYRSAEDILEAVKKLLSDGETIIINDEIVMVGERVYVKATVVFSDGKLSSSSSAFAREPEVKKGMDECQITGTASSYARKYALNGLFGIDDGEDSDTGEANADIAEKIDAAQSVEDLNKLWKKLDKTQQAENIAAFKARSAALKDAQ